MRRTMLIAAAVMMASPLMLGEASAASTLVPQMKAAQSAATAGIVEKAGYRHCARWSYRCHHRWGWGFKYRRCMVRHGC